MDINLITVVVYALVISLFLYGAKFAGFGSKFHDDFMSVDSTKSLRGFAALFVLLHHASQEWTFMKSHTIQAFMRLGPALVAIFFFCSGYGLIKNFDRKPEYLKGFLKKRLAGGILIPFYVNILLYGIYYLIIGAKYEPMQLFTKLTGLTLMNAYAWFPVVLIILYLAFYFIFKNMKNQKLCFGLMLAVILGQGVFFAFWGHFAWWADRTPNWWLQPDAFAKVSWWMKPRALLFFGEWWINSSIGFFIGMVFARKETEITEFFKKKYWLKLLIAFALLVAFNLLSADCQRRFGYYREYSGKGPGIGCKLITYLSQLPQMISFLIVLNLLRMKIKVSNPVTRFFGKYSLHTYLMNLIALEVFRFLIYTKEGPRFEYLNYNLGLFVLASILLSILLGLVEERICYGVNKLLFREKNQK